MKRITPIALIAGLFFSLRAVWVGAEGSSGGIQLDQRDWKLVLLFLTTGIGLIVLAIRDFRKRPVGGKAS
jgi:hypothetical protein